MKPVLYAEDDENDVFLMERAFKKLEIQNPLHIVSSGREAISYLAGTKPYESRMEPCLLLLDLSMPGKSGLDVLKWIREDQESRLVNLPVLVFSSSNQQSDISRAASLRADGFILKPGDPLKLINLVRIIDQYWLGTERPKVSFTEFATSSNIPILKAR